MDAADKETRQRSPTPKMPVEFYKEGEKNFKFAILEETHLHAAELDFAQFQFPNMQPLAHAERPQFSASREADLLPPCTTGAPITLNSLDISREPQSGHSGLESARGTKTSTCFLHFLQSYS